MGENGFCTINNKEVDFTGGKNCLWTSTRCRSTGSADSACTCVLYQVGVHRASCIVLEIVGQLFRESTTEACDSAESRIIRAFGGMVYHVDWIDDPGIIGGGYRAISAF